MSNENEPAPAVPRDAAYWAPKVDRLSVADEVSAHGYNVAGRRVTGPQQGFGRLWQRVYWVDLPLSVQPRALVADWKAHFADYWPRGSRFYGSLSGIRPGDVAPLEGGPEHGPKVATGVLVLYADDESFTFLTPEGHFLAGLITFSAEEADGGTRAHIRILVRTNDPLFELGWPVMRRFEDKMWPTVLHNIADRHGARDAEVQEQTECLDKRRIWKNWRNVRHNSAIRSAWHTVTSPFRSSSAATAG